MKNPLLLLLREHIVIAIAFLVVVYLQDQFDLHPIVMQLMAVVVGIKVGISIWRILGRDYLRCIPFRLHLRA